jgi:hypothetical protein
MGEGLGEAPHVLAAAHSYRQHMPRYLIERNLPGAGQLSTEELAAIARKSVEVLAGLAPRAQWVESFVTDDRITCVYLAEDEEALREHGRAGGFPVDTVLEVRAVIDPTTAEA